MSPDFQSFLSKMKKACISANKDIRKYFKSDNYKYEIKYDKDLLTELDKRSEEIIIDILNDNSIKPNLISEEDVFINNNSDFTYIIDPLCGTVNFHHKIPHFSIGISLQYKDCIKVGIVYDCISEQIFSAISEQGAYLNEKRIKIIDRKKKLNESVICLSDMDSNNKTIEQNNALIKKFLINARTIRIFGSANTDICNVALGSDYYDAYIKPASKCFDYLAPCLIVKEAGGVLSDFENKPLTLKYNNKPQDIVVTKGSIHNEIIKLIKSKTGV